MESTPTSPPPMPPPAGKPRFRLWQVITGVGLAILTGLLILIPPADWRDVLFLLIVGALLLLPILIGPAMLFNWLLTRLGQWRHWPARVVRGIAIAGAAAWVFGAGFSMCRVYAQTRDSTKLKTMVPREFAAAADQFFLECGNRIFLSYGELVGPQYYIKRYDPKDGEDVSVQFPIRRGWGETLPVRLPDGSTVQRCEVFAAVGRSGLVATYPRPQEGGYQRERVYRLESGVSYRNERVVNLPPDPAGQEGRDQDGVHTIQLPDGRRFEITYHGGVPDGPFRAFYADGRPWGEATYRQGRVTEAWIISRQGHRFDELHDGPAATKALDTEGKTEAEQHTRRGREKLAGKDFPGAVADFTAAINCYQFHGPAYVGRAEASLALGDTGSAIRDYMQARNNAETDADRRFAEQKLQELRQRK